MLKTLMLGNVIAQVATPVAVAIHTTPMVMSQADVDSWRARFSRGIAGVYGVNNVHLQEIINSIPSSLIEKHFAHLSTYSNTGDIIRAEGSLINEFVANRNTPDFTGMSAEARTLARTLPNQIRNHWSMESAMMLERNVAGRSPEQAAFLGGISYELEHLNVDIKRELINSPSLTEGEIQYLLKVDNDRHEEIMNRLKHGSHGNWSGIYNNINSNIHDLINGVNNIPNLGNDIDGILENIPSLDGLGNIIGKFNLRSMETYQKIIMWVSAAFTLFLSVGVFMTLARVSKNKSSKKLKTLLIILGTILLMVAAALGVMPFIGGE